MPPTTGSRTRARRIGARGYRWLLVLHALFGAAWLGSAVAGLLVLTLAMSKDTVVGAAKVIQLIDLLLFIPLDAATLITGLLFSTLTHWGFLKHGWVAAKYLINLFVMATAGILLSPAMITMDSLASAHGTGAWDLAEFQAARHLFIGMVTLYITVLGLAVALPLIKPRWPLPLQGRTHILEVSAIQPETADAATVRFRVPRLLRKRYRYRAGQYLTVITTLGKSEQRRAYSLSSGLDEPLPAITVKRVPGGLVSNWLLDNLRPGVRIKVQQPQGRFARTIDPTTATTCYLIAAGSGISPLAAIAKTVLHGHQESQVHLLYGNRTPEDVILHDELETLAATTGRLHITHVYSRLDADHPWPGLRGHITRSLICDYLSKHQAIEGPAEYLVCGPDGLIEATISTLADLGVPAQHIHRESFTTAAPPAAAPVQLTAELDGNEAKITTERTALITEALEAAGYTPPTTCRAGTCSTCIAQLLEGTVTMRQNHVLSPAEVASGLILTCQALPTSEHITIDYDNAA